MKHLLIILMMFISLGGMAQQQKEYGTLTDSVTTNAKGEKLFHGYNLIKKVYKIRRVSSLEDVLNRISQYKSDSTILSMGIIEAERSIDAVTDYPMDKFLKDKIRAKRKLNSSKEAIELGEAINKLQEERKILKLLQ